MAAQPRITPVPSNAPPFAYEFTKRMRERKDVAKKPSVRQTQSIPQLLSARYFRNGKLTLEDFLEAAVFTTFPPDQDIAREIAEDILLGRERIKKPDTDEEQQKAQASAAMEKQKDALQKVMDQIRREQELGKVIQEDKVKAGYDYLQNLHKNGDTQLYEAATDYLKDGDIVLRGITSDQELKELAGSKLLDKAGVLTSDDFRNAQTLDVLNDVCNLSNAAEQIAAKSLRGDDDVEEEFDNLAKRDTTTAARALRHIEEMETLDEETRKSLDRNLQDNLSNLSEAADYAAELERVPDNLDQHIQNAPNQYPLSDAAAFAERIKKHTGQDIMDDLFKAYDEQYDNGGHNNVDMRQLSETARDNQSWDSLLEKQTESIIQDADARSSPSDFLKSLVSQGTGLSSELS
ncbi:MAG: hypothetical protein EAX95_16400, partial [Candidatus Thorarchaeota archaeon]|nr:hypothetical protein [Candidatus Thorarchaeota archaeon]